MLHKAADVRARILGRPQISSDAFRPYADTIEWAFGSEGDYGQIVKVYEGEPGPMAARRYSPIWVVDVRRAVISGEPDTSKISTSYERRGSYGPAAGTGASAPVSQAGGPPRASGRAAGSGERRVLPGTRWNQRTSYAFVVLTMCIRLCLICAAMQPGDTRSCQPPPLGDRQRRPQPGPQR